jgi:hypothetical protein
MDLGRYQHVETTIIAADPRVVYDLVVDVSRMGEWSPVCTGGAWDDETHAWFTGSNTNAERTWDTRCRVEVDDPGREFAFVNCGIEGTADLVRWGFTFVPVAGGTEVSESWRVLPGYDVFISRRVPGMDVASYLDGVVEPTRQGMAQTLAKLKATAEGS